MHGVCIVMAKLLDDFFDLLLLALEDGIADDFLEPEKKPQRSVYGSLILRYWNKEILLQSTLLPPVVELVVQQPLD